MSRCRVVVLMDITVGVLALQGAFLEHIVLLKRAAAFIATSENIDSHRPRPSFNFIEVRTPEQLRLCDALVIPGGESTTISLVAAESGILEPLRDFVKYERLHPLRDSQLTKTRCRRKPTWGTCAGLILLAESANRTKKGGQELIGGLDVRVNRNHFGRQVESFQANLDLPFLAEVQGLPRGMFPGVFIRAPIVERILPNMEGVQSGEQRIPETVVAPSRRVADDRARRATSKDVRIMATLPGRLRRAEQKGALTAADDEAGDIVAVQQGNVFGISFHPELTEDIRIHVWWLMQIWRKWRFESRLGTEPDD